MRFRRKAEPGLDEDGLDDEETPEDSVDEEDSRTAGPWDSEEIPADGPQRIDVGSLQILPEEERAVQLTVDQATNQIQAVLISGPDGALELRAFAASRYGNLWDDARTSIAADVAQSGGTATERQGPFGAELLVQMGTGRGNETQTSRIVGVDGPRWLLRATFFGRPAAEPENAGEWEDTLRKVVVHRGGHAVPPGEALPLAVPPGALPQP